MVNNFEQSETINLRTKKPISDPGGTLVDHGLSTLLDHEHIARSENGSKVDEPSVGSQRPVKFAVLNNTPLSAGSYPCFSRDMRRNVSISFHPWLLTHILPKSLQIGIWKNLRV